MRLYKALPTSARTIRTSISIFLLSCLLRKRAAFPSGILNSAISRIFFPFWLSHLPGSGGTDHRSWLPGRLFHFYMVHTSTGCLWQGESTIDIPQDFFKLF